MGIDYPTKKQVLMKKGNKAFTRIGVTKDNAGQTIVLPVKIEEIHEDGSFTATYNIELIKQYDDYYMCSKKEKNEGIARIVTREIFTSEKKAKL